MLTIFEKAARSGWVNDAQKDGERANVHASPSKKEVGGENIFHCCIQVLLDKQLESFLISHPTVQPWYLSFSTYV
jgi:hypothetical protein